ncbi:hypothetical protein [Rhodoligotrophos defluvii]|uniref:hypothetical protein n=1 Tax=Rhodoligotrophos defluvii TaxID=2561934 RepID=UPI0010C95BB2|nr:hypothetical protein [Rhodoligotrophos defluvii]
MMRRAIRAFGWRLIARIQQRKPDVIIGGAERPYLRRWWIIPRNRWLNVYLHQFLRDDDDRALHDHPWVNCSILLDGAYHEIMPVVASNPTGPVLVRYRTAGSIVVRRPESAHRIALDKIDGAPVPCWSLFLTGPVVRSWGYWCPRGWRHWRVFTNPDDGGATRGRGCD